LAFNFLELDPESLHNSLVEGGGHVLHDLLLSLHDPVGAHVKLQGQARPGS
jgi:hypothetical protein